MNHDISVLLSDISDVLESYQVHHGDGAAFEALYALGYFAGGIISQAPDIESAYRARRTFLDAVSDATIVAAATKH